MRRHVAFDCPFDIGDAPGRDVAGPPGLQNRLPLPLLWAEPAVVAFRFNEERGAPTTGQPQESGEIRVALRQRADLATSAIMRDQRLGPPQPHVWPAADLQEDRRDDVRLAHRTTTPGTIAVSPRSMTSCPCAFRPKT